VIGRLRRYRSRLDQRGEPGDRGYTLIEIMITLTLSAVAIALVAPILTTVTNVSSATNSVANGSAQARQAMSQLSADIGSATSNNVCFPSAALTVPPTSTCSSAGTSGYPLVVLSNVYGTCTWFQWNVNSSSQLTQQSAARGATSWSPTTVLAGPVSNNSSQTLFSYDTTNSLMNIQLVLKGSTTTAVSAATAKPNSQSSDLQTSVALFTSSQSSGAGTC
jgi:prepilin-type N-terminal cleavage/methylation domain-containing protein